MLYACSPAEGNFPGSEYMPDMGHSVAMEAIVLDGYDFNTWDDKSTIELSKLVYNNRPVEGTVPRGFAGVYYANSASDREEVMNKLVGADQPQAISVPLNGYVPYYYEDTEEERTRAGLEIIDNPFPITADGLGRGKELYEIFCGICHGEKGNGLGWLVAEENANAKYPVVPANFLNDQYSVASNGTYYHAIMYGKNVMGAYKDKMSYEERWQVIHYIRSLQAKDKKLKYDENVNTLNPAFGMPMAEVASASTDSQIAEDIPSQAGDASEGETNHEEDHGGEDHTSAGDHGDQNGGHQSDNH